MVTVKYFEIKFCRSIAFNFQVPSNFAFVNCNVRYSNYLEYGKHIEEFTMKIVIFLDTKIFFNT